MVTVEDFSRLVSGVYAAAVTPQHWQLAIRDIHRTMGGTGGSLLVGDPRGVSFQNSTLPAEALQAYIQRDYHRLDYVIAAVEKGPVGVVRTGPEIVFRNLNREFYAGWMRPNELEDGLFVRLTGGPRPTCFLVMSPTRSFDTSERVKLMSALVPHLHQAVRTQDKLAALTHSTVEMAGALDVVRHGIVVVASEHLVVNLNSAAKRIFRAGDGLCMLSGRIAATSAHAERQLHLATHHALAGEGSTVRRGSSFTCVRPSGKRPYVIHVLPSHRRNADEPLKQPRALVLIIDPEDEPEPAAALLRRLYHLTKAEADVALRMIRRADLKQIAEELSVSLPTVRTHLQHVFDKTDTHRQAELVRLLLMLCP
jgi:DNA-binding CsgD family transcriptional regulator/PAS domain-containing protein